MKKKEVNNNDVFQQFDMFYLGLYLLGLTMVYSMLQMNDVFLMMMLFVVCISIYNKWLKKNREAQGLIYKQLKDLAIKSEEEYRTSKYHLLYSVETMIETFDGTLQDLTYVLVDLMDSGVINIVYVSDNKIGKTENVYALQKSPVKAQFRTVEGRKRVNIKDLKVTFNEEYAKSAYEQQV